MTQKLLIALITLLAHTSYLSAQEPKTFSPEEKFPADSIRNWTTERMDDVSKSHPGFYRYTSKNKFDALIASSINNITDSLNTIEYYRKMKPLFAQIGCLHTSLNLSDSYVAFMNKKANLIPIEIFIDGNNSVYITKNHSINKNVKIKSELLSINDTAIEEILAVLTKSIPSDGYNSTLKTLLLNHRFAFWYRSIIELNQNFIIKTKYKGRIETFSLNGIKSDRFESLETLQAIHTKQLGFDIEDNIGILTIKSFGKTDIKNNGQNFKPFIKSVFKTLQKKDIDNLIIDLRYNAGGTDGNAAFLTAHFFEKPFKYWDKVEVTEAIAKQIKGINRVFYKKPEKVDSIYLWKGALLTKEFSYYKTQKPRKNNFTGNVYIIANGLCMSSCSDVVAILSHNQKAVVVGQETGGGFQGNSSGMMPETEINGNMILKIPLQKYTSAVALDKNFGRGTIPDYSVKPTIDDWMNKKDVEIDFLKKLLKKQAFKTVIQKD
jgi:hypothetical protein